MGDERVKRKLAAIFALDVVGYSRLMGVDDAGTLAVLKERQAELINPTISKYDGRVFKLVGDGTLAEFASVVNAVQCAIEIQREMASRNVGVSDDLKFEFRIGVNLGEVILDGEDVYGDGVNVASRLEGLAEPGGICIARKVFREVHNKLNVGYHYIGEQKVKNIKTAVPTYRVLLDPTAAGKVTGEQLATHSWWKTGAVAAVVVTLLATVALWHFWPVMTALRSVEVAVYPVVDRASIAVLPFQNMSNDASQKYFADGIAEDIITDLSKISGLFVIARNTSFQYRGESLDLKQVGRKLGVRYILEGSVRRAENQVRINAQLIDTKTGGHVWAERYDGTLADIFSVQDKVTEQIIKSLKLQLSTAESQAVDARGTNIPAAYDAYLRGLRLVSERRRLDPEANRAAQAAFKEAIRLDPDYALAFAGLAWTEWLYFSTIRPLSADKAFELAEKSIALKDNALARRTLSKRHFSLLSTFVSKIEKADLGVVELEAAAKLQPNDSDVLADLALALCFTGRPDEALKLAQKAMELNPNHPAWYFAPSGIALLLTGKASRAAGDLEKWTEAAPSWDIPYLFLASAQALSGEEKQANRTLVRFDTLRLITPRPANLDPDAIRISLKLVKRYWPMASQQEAIFFKGLRLAGIKDAPG